MKMFLQRGGLLLFFLAALFTAGAWAQSGADDPFSPENELKQPGKPEKPAPEKPSPPKPSKDDSEFQEALRSTSFAVTPSRGRPGEVLTWKLTLQIAEKWHTYPLYQLRDVVSSSITQITFLPEGSDVVFVGDMTYPKPITKMEKGLEAGRETPVLYLGGEIVWTGKLVVKPDATPGEKTVRVKATIQVCDDRHCLPPRDLVFEDTITVTDESPVPVPEQYQSLVASGGLTQAPLPPEAGGDGGPAWAGRSVQGSDDLLSFIFAGVFWGFVSLLTPCVFPMIPITVSYFLKQSEKEHHRPVQMAVVYCATIIIVLTIGAVLLLSVFQAASQHWATNLILAALFVVFAFSLFGMYEITLPSGLANFTSSKQSQGGMGGTIFMALTFSIISFSCVAPFLGGFAALVPSFGDVIGMVKAGHIGQLLKVFGTLTLGALGFSVTFAAPFFVLAMFPSLLKALPRSGAWMNTVKVVMGFLEVAAAVKFLRAAELLAFGEANLLTYDLALGLYVAIALACGLYLFGVFRLPHDDPAEHLGVPRMIFGVLFISLGLYLTPGLFRLDTEKRQRPAGAVFAWLDSFLLPEVSADKHLGSLAEGLKEAKDKRKLVFVDFTGVS